MASALHYSNKLNKLLRMSTPVQTNRDGVKSNYSINRLNVTKNDSTCAVVQTKGCLQTGVSQ